MAVQTDFAAAEASATPISGAQLNASLVQKDSVTNDLILGDGTVISGVQDGVLLYASANQSVSATNTWVDRTGYTLAGTAPSWLTVDAAAGIFTVNADGTYIGMFHHSWYTNGAAGARLYSRLQMDWVYGYQYTISTTSNQTYNSQTASMVLHLAAGSVVKAQIYADSTLPYSHSKTKLSIARIK